MKTLTAPADNYRFNPATFLWKLWRTGKTVQITQKLQSVGHSGLWRHSGLWGHRPGCTII